MILFKYRNKIIFLLLILFKNERYLYINIYMYLYTYTNFKKYDTYKFFKDNFYHYLKANLLAINYFTVLSDNFNYNL